MYLAKFGIWEDLEAEWTASAISENNIVEPLDAEDPVRFGTRSCNIVIVLFLLPNIDADGLHLIRGWVNLSRGQLFLFLGP
jgi:hypothetical protein